VKKVQHYFVGALLLMEVDEQKKGLTETGLNSGPYTTKGRPLLRDSVSED
jgi:hypothetical protein